MGCYRDQKYALGTLVSDFLENTSDIVRKELILSTVAAGNVDFREIDWREKMPSLPLPPSSPNGSNFCDCGRQNTTAAAGATAATVHGRIPEFTLESHVGANSRNSGSGSSRLKTLLKGEEGEYED